MKTLFYNLGLLFNFKSPIPAREEFPIRFLFATELEWGLASLIDCYKSKPDLFVNFLFRNRLCGVFLYRLWQFGVYQNPNWDKNNLFVKRTNDRQIEEDNTLDELIVQLEKGRQKEVMIVAQRKLALKSLNMWVEDWNHKKRGDNSEAWISPIIFKGGATSLLFYPNESFRTSGDVDVLMPKEMLIDFAEDKINWEEHDCCFRKFNGFHVEGHQFTSIHDKNLNYEYCARFSAKLEGFSSLRALSDKALSCYVILNHFSKHYGELPTDLIDFSFLNGSEKFDFTRFEDKGAMHVLHSFKVLFKELYKLELNYEISPKDRKIGERLANLYFNKKRYSGKFFDLKRTCARALNAKKTPAQYVFYKLFLDVSYTERFLKKEHSKAFVYFVHFTYAPLQRLYKALSQLFSGK